MTSCRGRIQADAPNRAHAMKRYAKQLFAATFVMACSFGLAGCFDLAQKLSIDRGGSGGYVVAITASGLLGEALKDNKSGIWFSQNRVTTRTTAIGGKVHRLLPSNSNHYRTCVFRTSC